MSAYLCIPYADRIELLTDAAHIGPDNTIVKLERKVWSSSHCPIAITGRGDSAALENVATSVLKMAECGDATRVMTELSNPPPATPTALPFFEVLVAVYTADGPWAGVCLTHPPEGYAPLAMHRVGDFCYSYGGPAFDFGGFKLDDGLAAIGPYMFGKIRKTAGHDLSGLRSGGVYAVGGWCDHTTINAAGVVTRRLCRWPDKVGEKIEPDWAEMAA